MNRRDEPASAQDRRTLIGQIRKHMPSRHQVSHEWPYVAGSTCLVVLLVWHPFHPTSIVVFPPPPLEATVSAGQRSLQEIDASCYQVHTEAIGDGHCGEACRADKASSPRSDEAFEFSRSILTCQDGHGRSVPSKNTDKPQSLIIEVNKSNHSF